MNWCDYIKPKYGQKTKMCHMDTDCFIIHVKTEYIYKDIVQDVETRSTIANTSNYIFKVILKTQQKFKGDRHNVFTEEIHKIA